MRDNKAPDLRRSLAFPLLLPRVHWSVRYK